MTYKVIILAAGIGSRLRPLTLKEPKPLLKVGKRPIINHQISSFMRYGIRKFYVVVGYKSTMIMKHLSYFYRSQAEFLYIYNPRFNETNTAYSLWLASSIFLDSTTFVVNGDLILTPEAVSRIIDCTTSCLGYSKHSLGYEEVKVRLKNGRIVDIGKDLNPKKADAEYVGIAKFDRKVGKHFRYALNEAIKKGEVNLYYDDIIQRIVANFYIKGVDLTDLPVMEIDTIEELERARRIYEEARAEI